MNESPSTSKSMLLPVSPPRKRIRMGHLSLDEKRNVLNAWKSFEQKNPSEGTTKAVGIVSEMLGIAKSTIYRVIKEYKSKGEVTGPTQSTGRRKKFEESDESVKIVVRQIVHSFFFNNEPPTLDKIMVEIARRDDIPKMSRTTLYRFLKVNNFKFSKHNNKSLLIEISPPVSIPQQQENTETLLKSKNIDESNIKIFVKNECAEDYILPDAIDEPNNNAEYSNNGLQVKDENEMTNDDEYSNGEDTQEGIIETILLPAYEEEAISHFKTEEPTSNFDGTMFEEPRHDDIPSLRQEDIDHSIYNDEINSAIQTDDFVPNNFKQVCSFPKQNINQNDSEEDTDVSTEYKQTSYELFIGENQENYEGNVFTKPTENENMPELDDISQNTGERHHSEDSGKHYESNDNIEYLENLNQTELDTDDYDTVDAIHITANTKSQEDASCVIRAFIEKESSDQYQILKLQKQIPVLQHTINAKKTANRGVNKVNNKSLNVVKHQEKENVSMIAQHVVQNNVIKTNPSSMLKSSYFEQKMEKEKTQVLTIQKKRRKNKEALQAQVLQNFIAKTTILHAPIRHQKLPRKQTIKPVEHADKEIIIQEVVMSSNGFVETSENVKSKAILKPTEIELSDSGDDYDQKGEHKRKKRQRKHKLKVPEIITTDIEEEISDENVVQVDLSSDSDEEKNNKTGKNLTKATTRKSL